MRLLIVITLLFSIVSCHKPSSNVLIVGAIAGPEVDLLETAREVANKKYGIKVQIVAFNDYNLPNLALQDKSIDVNVFQHVPYLQAASKVHGYDFEVLGKTFLFPIGLYSKKIKEITEIPYGAEIVIPNDPSNEVRALLLLEKAGLIHLKNNDASLASKIASNPLNEIISNPKSIKIKAVDAAQLPRVLEDVEAAVINTNFAKLAGLSLDKDAIYVETKDSPYAEVVVTRKVSDKKNQISYLIEALHSNEVRQKAQDLFGNEAIQAW